MKDILMKTHYRDLRLSEPDNYGLLSVVIENEARCQSPLSVGYPNVYPQYFPCVTGTSKRNEVYADGSVSWDMPPLYDVGAPLIPAKHGWIGLYASIKNISIREATIILARQYHICPDAPLENDGEISLLSLMDDPRCRPYDGVRYPSHAGITIDGVPTEFESTIPVCRSYNGVEYVLCIWKTSCGKIVHYPYHKPGHQVSSNLRDLDNFRQWGFNTKNIPLLGLDVLEKYQQADVVVTDDAWCSTRINSALQMLDEGHDNVVAMSLWAGTRRVSNYSFAPLEGRNVVYVPTLHKDALTVGVKLTEILKDAGVRSFRVLMTPFASSEDQIEASRVECGDEACDRASVFSNRRILLMLDDMNQAWESERYKRFCEQEGLIEGPQQDVRNSPSPLFLPASRISDTANKVKQDKGFSFASIFDPSNITVIVGDSDAGKSLFARTLAVGMATGTDAFGMEASGSRDVYILNAEQDASKSEVHTQRAMSALGVKQIPGKLFDRPELSMSDREGLGRVDIFDAKWQDEIVEDIAAGGVLIVDNLLATSDKGLAHHSAAQSIKNFSRKLQKKQAALIVVHHTGKDGSAMGSKALESLAQNFILMHRADTREGFEGGVNALVTFQKIKSYPPYTQKKFRAHLELSYTPEDGTPWLFEAENGDAPSTPPRRKPDVAGLPKIDQDALMFAYEHGEVTRRELAGLGHNEETAKDHLAKLCDRGALVLKGEGRGAHYVLPEPNTAK